MSAEVNYMDLDARRRRATSDDTLARADALLLETVAGLRAALEAAAADGDPTDLRHAPPGALAVDLTGELAQRSAKPGKRLRPTLAHWGWVLAGGRSDSHLDLTRVAAALELLQLFALVQDDVMDRSDSRRGLPTLHVTARDRHRATGGVGDPELFGDSVAVLVSDLALSEATLLIAPTSPAVRAAWRLMAVELVEGQLLDVTHTADRRRDLATSRRIARFKSGRYTISRPLQLGALVAGAGPDLVRRLVTWGDLVGDAFAVRDDVLGVWGDPALTGKPAGDDLRSGKPTALLSWAAELLPDADRPLLAACDAGTLDDAGVAALAAAMEAAGVRERAEATISESADRALEQLDDLGADDEAAGALRSLVESIAWRSA